MTSHHIRHRWRSYRQTATVTPGWVTVDRQPTERFTVTLARCMYCGGELRALAGGSWVTRIDNLSVCRRRPRWHLSREHVINATHPDDAVPGWVWVWAVGVGVVLLVLAGILTAAFTGTHGG